LKTNEYNMTDRTPETQARYEEEMARRAYHNDTSCYLCSAPAIKESNNWRLVENEYPYDARYSVHHMLVLKRHATLPNAQEAEELLMWHLIATRDYDVMVLNLGGTRSIPDHFHVHLGKK